MSLKRLVIDGYGQLELNNVAFRRDGRIEAQCKLDETDFKSVPAENGMLLAVDNVKRVVRFPKSEEKMPLALHYSAEHMYDERLPGLKNFKLEKGSSFLVWAISQKAISLQLIASAMMMVILALKNYL